MMEKVKLPKGITRLPVYTEMSDWCNQHAGYVGESDLIWTEDIDSAITFTLAAFLPSAEDAVAFRLRFPL